MLSDYQTLVMNLVRDDAGKVSTTQRDEAIEAMRQRYSKDRPYEVAEDLTPASANYLPLPDAWETDFSDLRSLEYPIGNVPPTLIPQDRYSFYRTPSALKILLLDAVAVAADNVRATYTIRHTVTALADTIPTKDREAAACWAAALLCDALAALYSGGTDSTIQADSVQQRSKAQEYSARAKVLRKRYLDELGIEDRRAAPAGTVVQVTSEDSWGGRPINHPPLVRY